MRVSNMGANGYLGYCPLQALKLTNMAFLFVCHRQLHGLMLAPTGCHIHPWGVVLMHFPDACDDA